MSIKVILDVNIISGTRNKLYNDKLFLYIKKPELGLIVSWQGHKTIGLESQSMAIHIPNLIQTKLLFVIENCMDAVEIDVWRPFGLKL